MSRFLYVKQSLGPDEELVHLGHFHWMYNLVALMNIIWGIFFSIAFIWAAVYFKWHYGSGFYSDTIIGQIRELHPGIKLAAFFIFIFGLLGFARK